MWSVCVHQLVFYNATDIYKPIGKSWTEYVKNVFLGISFGQFPSRSQRALYTALLDIPKNRFIDLVQLLCFLNICCISIFVRKIGMQSNAVLPHTHTF